MARGAGARRHRLQIQRATAVRNQHGGSTSTWTTNRFRWGNVRELEGREFEEAQKVVAEVNIAVDLPYDSAMVATERILFGTRKLNVEAVTNPDGRKIATLALCREEVGK